MGLLRSVFGSPHREMCTAVVLIDEYHSVRKQNDRLSINMKMKLPLLSDSYLPFRLDYSIDQSSVGRGFR